MVNYNLKLSLCREWELCGCDRRQTADKETWGQSSQTVHRYRLSWSSYLSLCVFEAGLLYTRLSIRKQRPHWAPSLGIVCGDEKRVMADSTRPVTLLGCTSPSVFLLTQWLQHTNTQAHTCIQTHARCSAVSTKKKEKEDVEREGERWGQDPVKRCEMKKVKITVVLHAFWKITYRTSR